jgi:serine palmitoyltransferase
LKAYLNVLQDFAPLGNTFEAMFSNNIYKQGSDIVNRPLTTAPSTEISIQEREFGEELALKLTGKTQNAMNFGSYNYLGLSQTIGTCADATCAEIEKRGLCTCASDYESEVFPLQRQLENQVTRFLGTESALCFPNGFGINTAVLPRLANRNTLIMSDKLNHSSLLVGMQASGGTVVIFDHNGKYEKGG